MNSCQRIKRLAALACAAIALVCLSACCTKKVAEIGRYREIPGKVVHVAFDDDAGVLTIDYQARYSWANTGGGRSVRRRLCIPYDHLDLFYQCSIDCSASSEMLKTRQFYWWRNHPDFVLPSKTWDELDRTIDVPSNARSLPIRSLPLSIMSGDFDFPEAVQALRKGEVVVSGWRVWLPHGQQILSIRLPTREHTKPSARLIRPVLYPFAVVGDILLSPVYLCVILVWS